MTVIGYNSVILSMSLIPASGIRLCGFCCVLGVSQYLDLYLMHGDIFSTGCYIYVSTIEISFTHYNIRLI